jgi:cytochrome c
MTARLISAIVATLSLTGACISGAWGQSTATLERRGEALVTAKCAMCHATGSIGTSPHRVAPAFRTLHQRYPIEMLEEALGEGLSSGHPEMPEFIFDPRDVAAIVAYLKSIQERH